ncbi:MULTISPECIES: hypothetical protein [Xanthomonas]|uniref:hypothetical protein n=1 Tax=Xanthomonas TaxID=338 RepID=UPI00186AE009|nr:MULTISPECIES: hypothetical protein [Xanthomonas]MCW0396674.1 hypothetical protein [Xanthomonas sacchari]MCW0446715.1 hypothetical protein [Xanthomonas sacchari]MCW0463829.1 hypothetical protein [Xanthomonas sacchari]MDY4341965.1 hypothetical protein [Xanthomonas sp. LF07-6]
MQYAGTNPRRKALRPTYAATDVLNFMAIRRLMQRAVALFSQHCEIAPTLGL